MNKIITLVNDNLFYYFLVATDIPLFFYVGQAVKKICNLDLGVRMRTLYFIAAENDSLKLIIIFIQ